MFQSSGGFLHLHKRHVLSQSILQLTVICLQVLVPSAVSCNQPCQGKETNQPWELVADNTASKVHYA